MDRRELLEQRKQGIGGSDAPVVLGLSHWKTPFQLWQEKTGEIEEEESNSEILHFGNVLEQVVADEFSRRNNLKLQNRNTMYRHREHPELIAHIDRLIIPEGGILECKTSGAYNHSLWGESGSDEVPEAYLVQVMHYLHVTGRRNAFLAVLIGGQEYRQYEIEYDTELAEHIAAKCCEFWQLVQTHTPPPADKRDDLAVYYRNAGRNRPVTATPYIADVVAKYKAAKSVIKTETDALDELAAALKIYLGDNNADVLLDEFGDALATWRQTKDTVSVKYDMARLCNDFNIDGDTLRKYATESVRRGNRPLLVK